MSSPSLHRGRSKSHLPCHGQCGPLYTAERPCPDLSRSRSRSIYFFICIGLFLFICLFLFIFISLSFSLHISPLSSLSLSPHLFVCCDFVPRCMDHGPYFFSSYVFMFIILSLSSSGCRMPLLRSSFKPPLSHPSHLFMCACHCDNSIRPVAKSLYVALFGGQSRVSKGSGSVKLLSP